MSGVRPGRNSVQDAIIEQMGRNLNQFGYTRYDSGELRSPPRNPDETEERELVQLAEARMLGTDEVPNAELLSRLYRQGMISKEMVYAAFGMNDDGPKKETEQSAPAATPKAP